MENADAKMTEISDVSKQKPVSGEVSNIKLQQLLKKYGTGQSKNEDSFLAKHSSQPIRENQPSNESLSSSGCISFLSSSSTMSTPSITSTPGPVMPRAYSSTVYRPPLSLRTSRITPRCGKTIPKVCQNKLMARLYN